MFFQLQVLVFLTRKLYYCDSGVAGDEMDSEVLDQLEEDDMNETIMMSQHVYDDICNDNGDEVVEEVEDKAEKDKE